MIVSKSEQKTIKKSSRVLGRILRLSSPVRPHETLDPTEYMDESPSRSPTEAEQIDRYVGYKEIYRIYHIFVAPPSNCQYRKKSRETTEEPGKLVLGSRMLVELGEYSNSTHRIDECICRQQEYGKPTIRHIEWYGEFWTMSSNDPEHEWEHRYAEIYSLHTIHASKSIAKREHNHDQLCDSKSEWEHNRRNTPELITRNQDTECRYLIEEPPDDIGASIAIDDRVYIAKHRPIYEERRYDQSYSREFERC